MSVLGEYINTLHSAHLVAVVLSKMFVSGKITFSIVWLIAEVRIN